MSVKQISNDDLKNIGVIGLDDAPGLSKADMQAKFEETSRSVIIPRLNETIADHNKLAEEVESLTLNSGNVSLEQVEYWNSKLDATPESYRRLTKFCVVGGSVGWFKVGSVNFAEPLERYSAQIVVQSVHTNSEKGKMGCVSAEICVNADHTGLDSTSHITWSEASEFDGENIMVTFEADTLTAAVYIRTEAVTERIAIAVLLENNPTNAEHLLITSSNDVAELTEPVGMRSKKKNSMVLLWENASPNSSFPAQTVAVQGEKISDFKFILITTIKGGLAIAPSSYADPVFLLDTTGAISGAISVRNFTLNTEKNTVTFTGGVHPGVEQKDTFAIPFQVLGVGKY